MYEVLQQQMNVYADRLRPLLDDKTPAGRDARDAVRATRPAEPALLFSPQPFSVLVVDLACDTSYDRYKMNAVLARGRAAEVA